MKIFNKNKVKKASSRVVLHKLSNVVIKKNSNIEKEHIITKIKKHEKIYLTCLSSIILLIFILLMLLVGTSFEYFGVNEYKDGNLIIEYAPNENGLSSTITLNDSKILKDSVAKEELGHSFSIENTSSSQIKYQIIVSKDKELINVDQCSNNLYDDIYIKYTINDNTPSYLSKSKLDDYYLIREDIIPAKSTKYYNIKIWLDENTPINGKHFHGIIEIKKA